MVLYQSDLEKCYLEVEVESGVSIGKEFAGRGLMQERLVTGFQTFCLFTTTGNVLDGVINPVPLRITNPVPLIRKHYLWE